jgi:predicted ATP-dependent serine protease
MRADDRRAPYGPPFDAWELGDPHAVELVGPPGGGKSTCATQMAISAGRRVDVLYVAVEEGHSASLRKRSLRAGSNDLTDFRVHVADARTLPDLFEALQKCNPALVVVDSVTELGATPEEIATVLFGKSWIVVSQINSKGKPFGGHAFSHAVDTVVDVNDGVAVPRKNRFGPMAAITVFGRRVA